MRQVSKDCRTGQGIVEYALIVVGVALVVIIALQLTGGKVSQAYCEVTGALSGDGCGESGCRYDFNDASDLDNWSGWDVDRNFSLEEGKLCNSGSSLNYFDSCGEEPSVSDFTVVLRGVTIEQIKAVPQIGFDFEFRSNKHGDGYWFTYYASTSTFLFYKRVQGQLNQLAWARVPSEWRNQSVDITISAKGDLFTASVEDVVILQVQDDQFQEGTFGWRNKPGSETCIDEFAFE